MSSPRQFGRAVCSIAWFVHHELYNPCGKVPRDEINLPPWLDPEEFVFGDTDGSKAFDTPPVFLTVMAKLVQRANLEEEGQIRDFISNVKKNRRTKLRNASEDASCAAEGTPYCGRSRTDELPTLTKPAFAIGEPSPSEATDSPTLHPPQPSAESSPDIQQDTASFRRPTVPKKLDKRGGLNAGSHRGFRAFRAAKGAGTKPSNPAETPKNAQGRAATSAPMHGRKPVAMVTPRMVSGHAVPSSAPAEGKGAEKRLADTRVTPASSLSQASSHHIPESSADSSASHTEPPNFKVPLVRALVTPRTAVQAPRKGHLTSTVRLKHNKTPSVTCSASVAPKNGVKTPWLPVGVATPASHGGFPQLPPIAHRHGPATPKPRQKPKLPSLKFLKAHLTPVTLQGGGGFSRFLSSCRDRPLSREELEKVFTDLAVCSLAELTELLEDPVWERWEAFYRLVMTRLCLSCNVGPLLLSTKNMLEPKPSRTRRVIWNSVRKRRKTHSTRLVTEATSAAPSAEAAAEELKNYAIHLWKKTECVDRGFREWLEDVVSGNGDVDEGKIIKMYEKWDKLQSAPRRLSIAARGLRDAVSQRDQKRIAKLVCAVRENVRNVNWGFGGDC